MALNPERIQFFIDRISNSDSKTFSSSINQLFGYLKKEVKDNPVFDKYEAERKKWKNWPADDYLAHRNWQLPNEYDDAKSLSYDVYKSAAEQNDIGDKLSLSLFNQNHLNDNIYNFNQTFLGYFNEVLNDIINANPEIDTEKPIKTKGNVAFIIHGHDNELKTEVQLLLTNAGVNNFVLHEQPDKGRSIIDKLIEETIDAGYAIALLTPDDLTKEGLNRARQNVILELGYFLGMIGKERVRMIIKGSVEIPSDLNGILYEKYDEQGAWKIKLLKEMQAVGIYVDLQRAIEKF